MAEGQSISRGKVVQSSQGFSTWTKIDPFTLGRLSVSCFSREKQQLRARRRCRWDIIGHSAGAGEAGHVVLS